HTALWKRAAFPEGNARSHHSCWLQAPPQAQSGPSPTMERPSSLKAAPLPANPYLRPCPALPCSKQRNKAPADVAAATPIPARSDPQAPWDSLATISSKRSDRAQGSYIRWPPSKPDMDRQPDESGPARRSPL